MKNPRLRRDRGTVMVVALVLVAICAAVAAGSVLTHMGGQKAAAAVLARERAFQAADAGIDLGLARLRINRGALPTTTVETRSVDGGASFTLSYLAGNADGIDTDGDGTVDESDESTYTVLKSVGTSAGAKRTVRAVMSSELSMPAFTSSAYIASDVPILDLDGNSFSISGDDYRLNGSVDNSLPSVYGVTSDANSLLLSAQIAAGQEDNVEGTGGDGSVGTAGAFDFDALFTDAWNAATVELAPGTFTHAEIGTVSTTGMQVVRCNGDLHLSGGSSGAGVLCVNGDFMVTGSFEWTGIILVTGRAEFSGTGQQKVLGGIVCGEALAVGGNADIKYSSAAITMAGTALSVPVVGTWIDGYVH